MTPVSAGLEPLPRGGWVPERGPAPRRVYVVWVKGPWCPRGRDAAGGVPWPYVGGIGRYAMERRAVTRVRGPRGTQSRGCSPFSPLGLAVAGSGVPFPKCPRPPPACSCPRSCCLSGWCLRSRIQLLKLVAVQVDRQRARVALDYTDRAASLKEAADAGTEFLSVLGCPPLSILRGTSVPRAHG